MLLLKLIGSERLRKVYPQMYKGGFINHTEDEVIGQILEHLSLGQKKPSRDPPVSEDVEVTSVFRCAFRLE